MNTPMEGRGGGCQGRLCRRRRARLRWVVFLAGLLAAGTLGFSVFQLVRFSSLPGAEAGEEAEASLGGEGREKISVILTREHDLRGLGTTFFPEEGGGAYLQMGIERVFVENRRAGYFRVGLLPRPVVEELTIRVLAGMPPGEGGERMAAALGGLTGSERFELRGMTVENLATGVALQGERASAGNEGWRLRGEGRVLTAEGDEERFTGGFLFIGGARDGRLVWQDFAGATRQVQLWEKEDPPAGNTPAVHPASVPPAFNSPTPFSSTPLHQPNPKQNL